MRLVLLFPFILALAGCSDGAPGPSEVPAVRVFTVGQTGAGPSFVGMTLTGTVAARIESTLAFREPGRIVERLVDNGQAVRRGTLIARIDGTDLAEGAVAARSTALAATRAADAAEATALRTAADARRLEGLVEAGAISRSSLDATIEAARAAASRWAAARADAAAAQASARIAGNTSSYSQLRSDADGIVTQVLAEPGQVVAAGEPVIRLARSGAREIVVDVPEQQRGQVPQTATGRLYGGGTFRLELRELAAAADPVTRTYRARYRAIGASPPLGATVTLELPVLAGAASDGLPIAAVTERGGGPGVWTIARDSTVVWRPVTIRAIDGERIMATGLAKGTRIVALGAHLLQPGQKIRVASSGRVARR